MLEVAHGRRREHLAHEEHRQPHASLPEEEPERGARIGRVHGLDAAEAKLRLRFLGLRDVERIVHGDDAEHVPVLVHHGQRGAVVALEEAHDLREIGARRDGDERGMLQVTHARGRVRLHQRPEPQVEEERAGGIHHVQHVERLDATFRTANAIKRLARRHVRREAHVLRRHHVAGGALGVAEQRARGRACLRAERIQDAPRDLGRKVIEQLDAVVRRHGVDDLEHLLAGERGDQLRLLVHREVAEHGARAVAREQTEDHALVVGGKIHQDLRHVRVVQAVDDVPQPRPVAVGDQVLDLDLYEVSEHGTAG